ncbi:MAG: GtrA family protein [Lachnospiraceae bacterium]|nr:GtrA family protein [Lachnospiraceae bacterium]
MDKIKALWAKYKEIITYVFFGFVTTVVNYGVFALCGHVFHFDVVISNAIAWILAVIVAFITNKLWVFESKKRDAKTLGREFAEFVIGRLITLALESVLLWIFVDKIGVNDLIMKIITSVIVMAVNYIFSKFIIFKKKKAE